MDPALVLALLLQWLHQTAPSRPDIGHTLWWANWNSDQWPAWLLSRYPPSPTHKRTLWTLAKRGLRLAYRLARLPSILPPWLLKKPPWLEVRRNSRAVRSHWLIRCKPTRSSHRGRWLD